MKTLQQVIDQLEADKFITPDEYEELEARLGDDDCPIDMDPNGTVYLYRRRHFPEQFIGYANEDIV
jgi:hypothetical protein